MFPVRILSRVMWSYCLDMGILGNIVLNITMHIYRRNISSRFSSNSEVNASVLLENHEEMFPRC